MYCAEQLHACSFRIEQLRKRQANVPQLRYGLVVGLPFCSGFKQTLLPLVMLRSTLSPSFPEPRDFFSKLLNSPFVGKTQIPRFLSQAPASTNNMMHKKKKISAI
jgi:hypothetical protein